MGQLSKGREKSLRRAFPSEKGREGRRGGEKCELFHFKKEGKKRTEIADWPS